jgi:hypothetical protein
MVDLAALRLKMNKIEEALKEAKKFKQQKSTLFPDDDYDPFNTNMGEILHHATAVSNVESIYKNGIRPISYWGNVDIVSYYSETIEDDGDDVHVFEISLSEFDKNLLEPDYEGIEEPISTVIGKSEDTVRKEWENSNKTWQDSYRIIGSVRYRGIIHPRK